MNKREVLDQLDSLIDGSRSSMFQEDFNYRSYNTQQDIKALKIAKRAIKREYKYRCISNAIVSLTTVFIFLSFVVIARIMYK